MIVLIGVAVLICLATFTRNNRIADLLAFGGMSYLVGGAGPLTTDYATYEAQYIAASRGSIYFEKGYSTLGVLASQLGMSYADFRLILAIVVTLFLYIGVRRFTNNTLFFPLVYFGSVLFLDIIQIRNYVAISIVIFGLSFLKKVGFWNVIIAFFMLLLAAQFHTIGYVFMLAIPLRLIPHKYLYRTLLVLGGLLVIAMMGTLVLGPGYIVNILGKVAGMLTSRANLAARITSTYTVRTSLFRIAGLSLTTSAGVAFAYYLHRVSKFTDQELQTYDTLLVSFMVSFYMLIADFLAYDYSRIQRNGFLFLILMAAYYYEKRPEARMKQKVTTGIFFGMVAVLYFFFTCYLWRANDKIPYVLFHIGI